LPKEWEIKTTLRRTAFLALLIATTFGVNGCSTIRNRPTEGLYKEISFGSTLAVDSSKVVRHFTATGRSSFWFFRLVPGNKVNVVSIAEKQIGPGEGVVNLKAETQYDFIDILISTFTLGIYHTWHVEVSGDVVKLQSS